MKFGRKKSDQAAEQAEVEAPDDAVQPQDADLAEEAADEVAAAAPLRSGGPYDIEDVEIDRDDENLIDLGGLIIHAREGIELQMQVDEDSGVIMAVMMVGPDGAVELRPFAAPRNADIWDDARRSIAAEVTQRGGTATEADGPFGRELQVVMPVQLEDGQHAQQPSRVLGVIGPRWLLRATLFGRPAVEPDEDGDIENALREVVVVRGNEPMPPGEALPLTLPPNAVAAE
ncbi:MAG: DUF3710 domain-containing protein [Nocardioidaceae bacterium]